MGESTVRGVPAHAGKFTQQQINNFGKAPPCYPFQLSTNFIQNKKQQLKDADWLGRTWRSNIGHARHSKKIVVE